MPFYNIDPAIAEEFAEELGGDLAGMEASGGSTYQPAEAILDFDSLPRPFRLLRDALLAKHMTTLRGHYDGGYDEGFAYLDEAVVRGTVFQISEVVSLLASDELAKDLMSGTNDGDAENEGPPILAFPGVTPSVDGNPPQLPPEAIVEGVLDEFAYHVCTELLYEGFGTGEVAICGTYEIDLNTGRVEDIERRPETDR